MAILRTQHNKENPFVMINKYAIRNSSLSFKARGILCYLLEKPNNWRVYQSELVKNTTDGKDAVSSGIKELEEHGYIVKARIRDDKGKILRWEYIVLEEPQDEIERGKTIDLKESHLENDDIIASYLQEQQKSYPQPPDPEPENPDVGKNDETADMTGNCPEAGFPEADNPEEGNPLLLNNELSNKELNKNKKEEEGSAEKSETTVENLKTNLKQEFDLSITDLQAKQILNFYQNQNIINYATKLAIMKSNKNPVTYLFSVLNDWKVNKGFQHLEECQQHIKRNKNRNIEKNKPTNKNKNEFSQIMKYVKTKFDIEINPEQTADLKMACDGDLELLETTIDQVAKKMPDKKRPIPLVISMAKQKVNDIEEAEKIERNKKQEELMQRWNYR